MHDEAHNLPRPTTHHIKTAVPGLEVVLLVPGCEILGCDYDPQ